MPKKATLDNTERFIELRARGICFSKISEELSVSKPTLIQWARDLKTEIMNQRAFEMEALHEKYLLSKEKELERFSALLGKVEAAIDASDLSQLAPDKLFDIRDKLIGRMNAERTAFSYSEKVMVKPSGRFDFIEDDLKTPEPYEKIFTSEIV